MEDKLGRAQDPGHSPGENLTASLLVSLGAEQLVPLLLFAVVNSLARKREKQLSKQFTSGLTWFQVEAVCELPVVTGLA